MAREMPEAGYIHVRSTRGAPESVKTVAFRRTQGLNDLVRLQPKVRREVRVDRESFEPLDGPLRDVVGDTQLCSEVRDAMTEASKDGRMGA